MSEGRVKVLIADDHEVVRLGLRSLLENVDDIEVVGEAASGEEAIERAGALRPDVIVMDVRMPEMGGIEACRAIRSAYPEIKVIMLTSYIDDEAVFASVMAGASGYVLKRIGSQQLVDGIKAVAKGGSLLDPTVTGRVLERLRGGDADEAVGSDLVEELTEQEHRILDLIAQGCTNREIANQLYLSEKTVRNYVSNILGKLQVANRTQAAAYVLRKRLGGGDSQGV